MNEIKKPNKRPLVYYSIVALLLILIFNIFAAPALFTAQVKEVDYGTFMKMTEDGEFAQISKTGRAAALFTSTLGTFYGLWLVYAAGLKYLFLAVIFLALGVPVFIWARCQQTDDGNIFTPGEKVVCTLLVLFALTAVYVFARGLVSI